MRDVGPDGIDDGAKKGRENGRGGIGGWGVLRLAGVPAVNLAVSATVDSTSFGTPQESIQRG